VIPGLSFDQLMTLSANVRLVVLRDWAQGRVPDEELGTAIKTSFLIMARGFTRGPTQARVETELKKLLRTSGSDL
jgi:hypothetical protein